MLLAALFMPLALHAQQSLPYSCGFEDGDDTGGWAIYSESDGTGVYQGEEMAHGGSLFFGFRYDETNGYLVSPIFTGGDNGIDGSFWYREYSTTYGDEQFQVGYTTDESVEDPSEFTYDAVVTATTEWQEYTFSFPARTKRIAVKYIYNDTYYLFLDDFEFWAHGAAVCNKPMGLTANNVGNHTATLNWTSDASSWQICINDDESHLINVNQTSYTLSGLTPETEYNVKVRTDCGNNTLSAWASVSFTTDVACPAPEVSIEDITATTANVSWTSNNSVQLRYRMAPSSNDFEDGSLGVWTTIDADGDGNAWYPLVNEDVPGHDGSLGIATSASYFGYALTPDNYLVSPPITFGGSISFYACAQDANWAAEHFGVAISTNGNTNAASFTTIQEWTMNADGTREQGTWGLYTVDLSDYTGQTGYVAIRHFDCTDQFRLNVDDITILQPGVTEPQPWTTINNNVTNPYALTGLSPETTYQVQVRSNCTSNNDGYSVWTNAFFTTLPFCLAPTNLTIDNITTTSAIVSWTGNASSYNLKVNNQTYNDVTSPYSLSGLTAATSYTVEVQSVCSATSTSTWTSSEFTTEICEEADKCLLTFVLTDSYGDTWNGNAIKVVDATTNTVIATLTNDYNNYEATSSAGAYTQTKTLAVCNGRQLQFVWERGSYPGETSWVIKDVNGEEITSGTGNTSMQTGDVLATYTVDCTITSCRKPTDLQATEVTAHSVTLSWTENGEATAWVVWYSSGVEPATVNVTETSVTIPVDMETTYTAKVRPVCDVNDKWSDEITFTTKACDDACSISYVLTANAYQGSYSYGWYYSGIKVLDATTGDQIAFWTVDGGNASIEGILTLCSDTQVTFQWYSQNATNDQILVGSYAIYDHLGDLIAGGSGPMSEDVNYTMDCTMPDCMWPTNITVEPSYTSATISWEGEETNAYNVQYRTAPVIFYDGFEYGLDNWTIYTDSESVEGHEGWYAYDATTLAGNHSGNFVASAWSWQDSAIDADNWLITPQIELGGTLTFWVVTAGNWPDEYAVLLSTSGNAERDFTVTLQEMATASGEWTPVEIDLSSYAGNRGYIAIHHLDNNENYLLIDDFMVVGDESEAGRWMAETIVGTSIELEDLDIDTFYEYQIQNDCGSTQSYWKGGLFQTLNDNEKTFNNDGYWNVDANWMPEGVPTASQNVTINAVATIPSGCIATPNNITIGENGAIIIEDGGQLINYNDVEVTIQKNITGYGDATSSGWNFISTSVWETQEPSVENGIINEENEEYYDLFEFKGDSASTEWQNYKNYEFDMYRGFGYLYANHDNTTLEFTGTVRSLSGMYYAQGTYLTYTTDIWGAWNLVGNIFATNAQLYLYDGATMDPISDLYKVYETEEGSKIMLSDDAVLAPTEGALIEATAPNLYLIIGKAENTKAASMLNIAVMSNGSKVDMARVRFNESNALTKFQLNANDTKVYFPQDDKDYAVVSAGNEGEMPVNFKAEKNGTYTISVNSENVEFGYLHLIDNMTGNDIDLLANPSYTFEAKTTDYASRFRLVFSAETEVETFAYYNGSAWVVNGTGTMQMVDMTGRVLSSENVTGIATVNTNKLSAGVYVMRLVNGNDVKTQKIVVR